ncbi:DDE-type integrase/transposase/recombinase [Rapidithrix thailandica]|uniref:DDE-type integrase/transposase/recombinase n=1 Tax=Rapidithrix thailandica TaxID=413964 RepID=A0AAW9SD09_9BACT
MKKTVPERKSMIDKDHASLSLVQQCILLSISRSSLYYRKMGLRSLLPGPHTSKPSQENPVYPYLLRGLEISHPNQVWATDITYIPMKNGFMYLMAIIDLYSRYVVHWSVSNSMEVEWVVI